MNNVFIADAKAHIWVRLVRVAGVEVATGLTRQ